MAETTRRARSSQHSAARSLGRGGVLPHPRRLIEIGPHGDAHWAALRAGIAVAVPLVVLYSTDHMQLALYAAFGAFTALYGRTHTHVTRARMQATAGVGLLLAVVAGTAVSAFGMRDWLILLLVSVMASAMTFVSDVLNWHPPGALFFVFAMAACASVPATPFDIVLALATASVSAAFAMAISTVGVTVPRWRSRRPTRLVISFRATATRPGEPLRVLSAGVAVLAAGAIPTVIGMGHPYWAMVAASAALGAADTTGHLVRAGQRVLGTLLGVALTALLLAVSTDALEIIAFVVLLQIGAELFVMRNYGLAMIFVTPLALLMTQLARPLSAGVLLRDRMTETLLGAAVGIAVSLVGAAVANRSSRE
ncbi:FUSC family protein [Microbacterium betulae]|uniref:FUSC family protein n=1 Tax=Microbacterium betulae TaxID=2981139 RepID=A0AA97FM20_9MICO|nr:FUSC family protein [Microbacterium sp. AB]WOF23917.1 FUSC family protein [Microbacterium sp. AB]